MLKLLDVGAAQASRPEDLSMIMGEIAKYQGSGVSEGFEGVQALNKLLESLVSTQVHRNDLFCDEVHSACVIVVSTRAIAKAEIFVAAPFPSC